MNNDLTLDDYLEKINALEQKLNDLKHNKKKIINVLVITN